MRHVALLLGLASAPVLTLGGQTTADYQRCLRAGSDAAALAGFERQVSEGGATGAFAAGCVDHARRRHEAASRHFEAAAAAAPRSAAAWTMYGTAASAHLPTASLFWKARNASKLKRAFETAIALEPANLDARTGLMQFLLQAPGFAGGDKAKAREQADAIARTDSWRGTWARVEVAQATGDADLARRALSEATTAFPDSSQPWLALAGGAADEGDGLAAWATLERWRKLRPDAAALGFAVGRVAAAIGERVDEGERALRSYLGAPRRPSDPPVSAAQFRLGQLLERAGRTADARAAYGAALRADPQLTAAKRALARL